ncbi:hypothetical protein BK008_09765 [Methanobacterium sp. MZ-A1]|uniref:hypothetical protein n=1 Tax=Methanobacterium sp. MZ-A1 TaxID=1911685 RepID=UPI000C2D04CA|nr:hypothetical protein [Methanobacterium sp. MZ-A1]AUB58570.1 hypothetical protein BK008_09765 [Methanobacterium sp. MZ-A1]
MWGDNTAQIILNFEKRDFLYDNGLVNVFLVIMQDSRFENISDYQAKYKNTYVTLKDLELEISGDFEEIKEIYFILRSGFYAIAFEETSNLRIYYNPLNDGLLVFPKLNTRPWLPRLKVDKLLCYAKLDEDKIKELEKDIEQLEHDKKFEKKLRHGKKSEVFTYLPPLDLGEYNSKKIKQIVEDKGQNACVLCGSKHTSYKDSNGKNKPFKIDSTNLIFDFGTGDSKPSFRDSRTKKDVTICFICDIIYRWGLMKNYFVDNNLFIISGPSLPQVYEAKISLNLNEEYLDVQGKDKTNFLARGNFVALDMNSRLLLLLYKIYMNFVSRDKISLFSIFYFVVDGTGIDDLKIYNKISYIVELFDKTRDLKISGRPFFHLIMDYTYYKDIKTTKNKNLPKKLAYEILNAMPIDFTLFYHSYYDFSSDSPSGLNQDLLYKFLETYLEVTGMVDLKELHEICMIVGDRIGYFAANTNNKNLLYELREIGNLENLTEFFRDLEYAILKEDAGAIWNSKPDVKNEKYSDFIHKLLLNVHSNKDTALVRNYLGIYAVQKYMSTKYAKSKRGD